VLCPQYRTLVLCPQYRMLPFQDRPIRHNHSDPLEVWRIG
jgi:hypothetical protein